MPPENNEDFDASLTVTLNDLQDLRSTLSTDIFISYCAANAPSGGDLDNCVHPRLVKEDLNAAGFKWYVTMGTCCTDQVVAMWENLQGHGIL